MLPVKFQFKNGFIFTLLILTRLVIKPAKRQLLFHANKFSESDYAAINIKKTQSNHFEQLINYPN